MSVTLIPEIAELLRWVPLGRRHPQLLHGLDEADCECLPLAGGGFLLSSIDCLAEELAFGLYRDPFTVGWVAVMAALSDLAACGGVPLGVLQAVQWGAGTGDTYKSEVARGVQEALTSAGTWLLGGDTSNAVATSLTTTVLGTSTLPPVGRKGAKPGEHLVLVGEFGCAAALALRFLLGRPVDEFPDTAFRPRAQLDEGRLLASSVSAVIDTSDGLLTALGHLCAVNDLEVSLSWDESLFEPGALRYLRGTGLCPLLAWFVEHGDYQLLCTVPEDRLDAVLRALPTAHLLGRMVRDGSHVLLPGGRRHPLPLRPLLDRLWNHRADPAVLLGEMRRGYAGLV